MSQQGLNNIPTVFLTVYLIFSWNAFVLAVS